MDEKYLHRRVEQCLSPQKHPGFAPNFQKTVKDRHVLELERKRQRLRAVVDLKNPLHKSYLRRVTFYKDLFICNEAGPSIKEPVILTNENKYRSKSGNTSKKRKSTCEIDVLRNESDETEDENIDIEFSAEENLATYDENKCQPKIRAPLEILEDKTETLKIKRPAKDLESDNVIFVRNSEKNVETHNEEIVSKDIKYSSGIKFESNTETTTAVNDVPIDTLDNKTAKKEIYAQEAELMETYDIGNTTMSTQPTADNISNQTTDVKPFTGMTNQNNDVIEGNSSAILEDIDTCEIKSECWSDVMEMEMDISEVPKEPMPEICTITISDSDEDSNSSSTKIQLNKPLKSLSENHTLETEQVNKEFINDKHNNGQEYISNCNVTPSLNEQIDDTAFSCAELDEFLKEELSDDNSVNFRGINENTPKPRSTEFQSPSTLREHVNSPKKLVEKATKPIGKIVSKPSSSIANSKTIKIKSRNPGLVSKNVTTGIRTAGKTVRLRNSSFFNRKVLSKVGICKKYQRMGLAVYPAPGLPLHPVARLHLDKLRENNCIIDEKWAEFAVAAVPSDDLPERRIIPAIVPVHYWPYETIIKNFKETSFYKSFNVTEHKIDPEILDILETVKDRIEYSPSPPVKELSVVMHPLNLKNIVPYCLYHKKYLCVECGLSKNLLLQNLSESSKNFIEKGYHLQMLPSKKNANKVANDSLSVNLLSNEITKKTCTSSLGKPKAFKWNRIQLMKRFQSFVTTISFHYLRESFIFEMIHVFLRKNKIFIVPYYHNTRQDSELVNVKLKALIPKQAQLIFYSNLHGNHKCTLTPVGDMWECNLEGTLDNLNQYEHKDILVSTFKDTCLNQDLPLGYNWMLVHKKRDFDRLIVSDSFSVKKSTILKRKYTKCENIRSGYNDIFGVYNVENYPSFFFIGPFASNDHNHKVLILKNNIVIPLYPRVAHAVDEFSKTVEKVIKRFSNYLLAGNHIVQAIWIEILSSDVLTLKIKHGLASTCVRRVRRDILLSNVPGLGYVNIYYNSLGLPFWDKARMEPIGNLNQLNTELGVPDGVTVEWCAYPPDVEMTVEEFSLSKCWPILMKLKNTCKEERLKMLQKYHDTIILNTSSNDSTSSASTCDEIGNEIGSIQSGKNEKSDSGDLMKRDLSSPGFSEPSMQISFEHSYSSSDKEVSKLQSLSNGSNSDTDNISEIETTLSLPLLENKTSIPTNSFLIDRKLEKINSKDINGRKVIISYGQNAPEVSNSSETDIGSEDTSSSIKLSKSYLYQNKYLNKIEGNPFKNTNFNKVDESILPILKNNATVSPNVASSYVQSKSDDIDNDDHDSNKTDVIEIIGPSSKQTQIVFSNSPSSSHSLVKQRQNICISQVERKTNSIILNSPQTVNNRCRIIKRIKKYRFNDPGIRKSLIEPTIISSVDKAKIEIGKGSPVHHSNQFKEKKKEMFDSVTLRYIKKTSIPLARTVRVSKSFDKIEVNESQNVIISSNSLDNPNENQICKDKIMLSESNNCCLENDELKNSQISQLVQSSQLNLDNVQLNVDNINPKKSDSVCAINFPKLPQTSNSSCPSILRRKRVKHTPRRSDLALLSNNKPDVVNDCE